MKNNLRSKYGLKYYQGDFQSSLTIWYNKVIDKSVEDLDICDVTRMIRQNILLDVAINRAIELFLANPFNGEMQEGDLLKLLVDHKTIVLKNNKVRQLLTIINKVENRIEEYDWINNSDKIQFKKNLVILKQTLLNYIQ